MRRNKAKKRFFSTHALSGRKKGIRLQSNYCWGSSPCSMGRWVIERLPLRNLMHRKLPFPWNSEATPGKQRDRRNIPFCFPGEAHVEKQAMRVGRSLFHHLLAPHPILQVSWGMLGNSLHWNTKIPFLGANSLKQSHIKSGGKNEDRNWRLYFTAILLTVVALTR